jgi:DNA-binding transcriptional LysR family regulator
MIPSPADLTYFMEIAETGNVSRAAERLGISQPSLSLALRRLERDVGAAVFTRGKRGVTLTPSGRQLLTQARRLHDTWQDIRADALASLREVQGSYTLGCHASVGLPLLPSVLPQLLAQYPKLDIRLRHDLSRRVAEGVISAVIDIGIVVNPVAHPDLVIHRLCHDDVTLWHVPRHNRDVLICDPDLAQSQVLMKKLKKKNMSFARVVTTPSLEMAAALAAAGAGVAILPARVARLAPVKMRRMPDAPVFQDEHCLIYRMENKNVRAVQAMAGAIRACF